MQKACDFTIVGSKRIKHKLKIPGKFSSFIKAALVRFAIIFNFIDNVYKVTVQNKPSMVLIKMVNILRTHEGKWVFSEK